MSNKSTPPSTRAGESRAHIEGVAEALQPAPEVVFRPDPPVANGARQGLGPGDQGGHHHREDGHQLPELCGMEQRGEGEDVPRVAIGELGKRGQGCPEDLGGTRRRETAGSEAGHGSGRAWKDESKKFEHKCCGQPVDRRDRRGQQKASRMEGE